MREAILLAGGLLLLYNAMDRSEARAEAQVEGKGHTQTLNTASQYDYRSDHAHILNALTPDIDNTGPTLTGTLDIPNVLGPVYEPDTVDPPPSSRPDDPDPGGVLLLPGPPPGSPNLPGRGPPPDAGGDGPELPPTHGVLEPPPDPGAGDTAEQPPTDRDKRRRRRKKRAEINQTLTTAHEEGEDAEYAKLKNALINDTLALNADENDPYKKKDELRRLLSSGSTVRDLLAHGTAVATGALHTGGVSMDEVEALKMRAASNEAAQNILLDDVQEAQRQGLSYDKFREGYRPVGGDESLRAIWESEASVPVDITSPKAAEFVRYSGHVELLRDLENSVAQDMSFTEALMARDSGDILDGLLSTRITADSGTVQYWTELGGNLTNDELEQIASNTRESQVERVIQGESGAPVRPRFTAADVESVRFDGRGLLDEVYERTIAIGKRLGRGEAVVLPEGFGDAGNYTLFRGTAGDVRPSGYNPLAQDDLDAINDLNWTGGDGTTMEEFGPIQDAAHANDGTPHSTGSRADNPSRPGLRNRPTTATTVTETPVESPLETAWNQTLDRIARGAPDSATAVRWAQELQGNLTRGIYQPVANASRNVAQLGGRLAATNAARTAVGGARVVAPVVAGAAVVGLEAWGIGSTTRALAAGEITALQASGQYADHAAGLSMANPAGLGFGIFSQTVSAISQAQAAAAHQEHLRQQREVFEAAVQVQDAFLQHGLLPRTADGRLDVANMTNDDLTFIDRLYAGSGVGDEWYTEGVDPSANYFQDYTAPSRAPSSTMRGNLTSHYLRPGATSLLRT